MKATLKIRTIISGIVFIIVGIGLITASVYVSNQGKKLDGLTTATIVDIVESTESVDYGNETEIETVYTQYITYEVDGKKYENVEFGTCDKNTKIGDSVEVKYDTKDPERITSTDTKTPIIVGIGGGISIIVGLYTFFKFFLAR